MNNINNSIKNNNEIINNPQRKIIPSNSLEKNNNFEDYLIINT